MAMDAANRLSAIAAEMGQLLNEIQERSNNSLSAKLPFEKC